MTLQHGQAQFDMLNLNIYSMAFLLHLSFSLVVFGLKNKSISVSLLSSLKP